MCKCYVILMFTLVISIVSGKEVIPEELSVKQNKYIQKCKQDFIFEQRSEEKVSLSDDKNMPPRQFKCMLACFAEGMGYLKGNKLDWSAIKRYQTIFHEDKQNKTLKVLETCQNLVKDGEEKCELSFKLARCLQEEFLKPAYIRSTIAIFCAFGIAHYITSLTFGS